MCKSRYFINITLLLIVLLFVNCSENKNRQQPKTEAVVEKSEVIDENSLFDGETLDGWKITGYGTEGPVLVSDGKIVLNFGDGCTGVTWVRDFPKVNYEVTLEARRTVGNDFFCGITFPVNDEFCSLIIGGWGGPVVGLSNIDGLDAGENETNVLKKFERNTWYKIKLQVTNEKIIAWIDDEKLVDFSYSGRRLSLRSEVQLSKPFGLFTWQTTGEIRNIRMQKL
ncbi:MAG: hypothetical protein FD181_2275 [Prolixibacteraceae bacterium]|mgnify:CR=1 FL=1|nr:MAG: hypothetical protein FD181_2275 [Prolixibacteraceae bacterium]